MLDALVLLSTLVANVPVLGNVADTIQLFGCIGAVCAIAAITTGVVYRNSLKSYPVRSARKWVDVRVVISPQDFLADGKATVRKEGFPFSLARPTAAVDCTPGLDVLVRP